MNLHSVCSIFDKKTGLYGSPVTVVHVGEAVREFDALKRDKGSKIEKNPEDFDLMHIGHFDVTKGVIHNLDHPVTLASGV